MAGDIISLRMVLGFAWVGGNGQERRASEAQFPVAFGEGAVVVEHPPLLHACRPACPTCYRVGPCLPAILPFIFLPVGADGGSGSQRLLTRLSPGHRGGGERGSWVRARM